MPYIANPFYAARRPVPVLTDLTPPSRSRFQSEVGPVYTRLPVAPRNGSPVPHLTSLYHFSRPGNYGSRSYPGNCGGNLIKDLIRFYDVKSVFDPMTGSGYLPGCVPRAGRLLLLQ